MIMTALLAAVLAAPASAQVLECKTNEMTSAWEKISFALWLTDYTIPDSSPRTATLVYKGCSMGDEGEESRSYVSADGNFIVTAFTNHGGDNGATTLTLYRGARWARLGTWAHHKVFYKGVGIDKVAVPNGGDSTIVKNVFVIPEGAVIKKP
ncbi:MAG: hypothetical protein HY923_04440 [Elusimicrobia bacterium]|nr:hypothetical protein [Elusimicrobiota bacterium]